MNEGERGYLNIVKKALEAPARKERTGTGAHSMFGEQLRFNLREGFPLLTTKRVHFKSVIHELIWFLSGSTNIKYLQDNGVTIWNEWADKNGDLGPVYGKQWRDFNGVDQLSEVIESLKRNPFSRRHVVSAWNPSDVKRSALPPCHVLFQFFVTSDWELSLQVYQRSADLFLGVPFNIASYALLTHMVAQQTGMTPGDLVWVGGDCHVYLNHVEQCREQVGREPRLFPELKLSKKPSIFMYEHDDVKLVGYTPHPSIHGEVAV